MFPFESFLSEWVDRLATDGCGQMGASSTTSVSLFVSAEMLRILFDDSVNFPVSLSSCSFFSSFVEQMFSKFDDQSRLSTEERTDRPTARAGSEETEGIRMWWDQRLEWNARRWALKGTVTEFHCDSRFFISEELQRREEIHLSYSRSNAECLGEERSHRSVVSFLSPSEFHSRSIECDQWWDERSEDLSRSSPHPLPIEVINGQHFFVWFPRSLFDSF